MGRKHKPDEGNMAKVATGEDVFRKLFGRRSAWQPSVGRWHRENRLGALLDAGAQRLGHVHTRGPVGSKRDTDGPGPAPQVGMYP